jgi:hypothetical protein
MKFYNDLRNPKSASLFCIATKKWTLHLFVRDEYREWGYGTDWYDGPFYHLGGGPLFLFIYHPALEDEMG